MQWNSALVNSVIGMHIHTYTGSISLRRIWSADLSAAHLRGCCHLTCPSCFLQYISPVFQRDQCLIYGYWSRRAPLPTSSVPICWFLFVPPSLQITIACLALEVPPPVPYPRPVLLKGRHTRAWGSIPASPLRWILPDAGWGWRSGGLASHWGGQGWSG